MANPQAEVDIITDFKNKIDIAGQTIQELVTLATGRAKSNNDAVTKCKNQIDLLVGAEKFLQALDPLND